MFLSVRFTFEKELLRNEKNSSLSFPLCSWVLHWWTLLFARSVLCICFAFKFSNSIKQVRWLKKTKDSLSFKYWWKGYGSSSWGSISPLVSNSCCIRLADSSALRYWRNEYSIAKWTQQRDLKKVSCWMSTNETNFRTSEIKNQLPALNLPSLAVSVKSKIDICEKHSWSFGKSSKFCSLKAHRQAI